MSLMSGSGAGRAPWTIKELRETLAWRDATTPLRWAWPELRTRGELQQWYEKHCKPKIDVANQIVRKMLLDGPRVSVDALAEWATQRVLEEVDAGNVLRMLHGGSDQTTIGSATKQAEENRRRSAGVSSAAAAAFGVDGPDGSDLGLGPVGSGQVDGADSRAGSASAGKKKVTIAATPEEVKAAAAEETKMKEFARTTALTLKAPLQQALMERQSELYSLILTAVHGAKLQWRSVSGASAKSVTLASMLRTVATNDAGGLWLVVCRECFFPHPLLTRDKARQTAFGDGVLLSQRRELVAMQFAGEQMTADDTLQTFAERLCWWRHAYEQVDAPFTPEMVVTRLSTRMGEESETINAVWTFSEMAQSAIRLTRLTAAAGAGGRAGQVLPDAEQDFVDIIETAVAFDRRMQGRGLKFKLAGKNARSEWATPAGEFGAGGRSAASDDKKDEAGEEGDTSQQPARGGWRGRGRGGRGRGRGRGRGWTADGVIICHRCSKPGHPARECEEVRCGKCKGFGHADGACPPEAASEKKKDSAAKPATAERAKLAAAGPAGEPAADGDDSPGVQPREQRMARWNMIDQDYESEGSDSSEGAEGQRKERAKLARGKNAGRKDRAFMMRGTGKTSVKQMVITEFYRVPPATGIKGAVRQLSKHLENHAASSASARIRWADEFDERPSEKSDGFTSGSPRQIRRMERKQRLVQRRLEEKEAERSAEEQEVRAQARAARALRDRQDERLKERIYQDAAITAGTPERKRRFPDGKMTPHMRRESRQYLDEPLPAPPAKAERLISAGQAAVEAQGEKKKWKRLRQVADEGKETEAEWAAEWSLTAGMKYDEPRREDRAPAARQKIDGFAAAMQDEKQTLVPDSGATLHVHAGDLEELQNVRKLDEPRELYGITDGAEPLKCTHVGMREYVNGYKEMAYYCPGASMSLSSVAQTVADGLDVVFTKSRCRYMKPRQGVTRRMIETKLSELYEEQACFFKGSGEQLYSLNNTAGGPAGHSAEKRGQAGALRVRNYEMSKGIQEQLLRLHEAYTHVGARALKKMIAKNAHLPEFKSLAALPLTVDAIQAQMPCDGCARANTRTAPKAKVASYSAARWPMEHVFVDASGEIHWDFASAEPAVRRLWERELGWIRFALMVDVSSQYVIYHAFERGESIGAAYRRYLVWGKRQTGGDTLRVSGDQGGENMSTEFQTFMKNKGIEWHDAPTGQKELNGQVEVYMGIVVPRACAMCVTANLHAVFLSFAMREAVRVMNMLPPTRRSDEKAAKNGALAALDETQVRPDETQVGPDVVKPPSTEKQADHVAAVAEPSRHERFFGRPAPHSDKVPPIWGSDCYVVVDPTKMKMMRSQKKQFGGRRKAIFLGFDVHGEHSLVLIVDVEHPTIEKVSELEIRNGQFTFGREHFHYGRKRTRTHDGAAAKSSTSQAILMDESDTAGRPMTAGSVLDLLTDDELCTIPGQLRMSGMQEQSRAVAGSEQGGRRDEDEDRQDNELEPEQDNEHLARRREQDEHDQGEQKQLELEEIKQPEFKTVELRDEPLPDESDREAKTYGQLDEESVTTAPRSSQRERRRVDKPGFLYTASHAALSDDEFWSREHMKFTGMPDPKARALQPTGTRMLVEGGELMLEFDVVFDVEEKQWQALSATHTAAVTRSDGRVGQRDDKQLGAQERAALTLPGPQTAREYQQLDAEERKHFDAAKEKQDRALPANGTYELVPEHQVPKWARVLESRYVWTKKVDDQGRTIYKARLVVKDLRFGAVLGKNYSPVIASKSVRTILRLCALFGMKMYQVDLNDAFLHALLDGDVYVRFPKGYERLPGTEGMVMKLKKSLYGLQEAPRRWYETLLAFMKEHGWHTTLYDPCLFFRRTASGGVMLLGLHVDDQLGGTTQHADDVKWMEEFMKKLEKRFGIKGPHEPTYALGLDIRRDAATGDVYLSQRTYVKKMLDEFDQLDSSIPAVTPEKHSNPGLLQRAYDVAHKERAEPRADPLDRKRPDETQRPDETRRKKDYHTDEWYRSAIGALLFATHTRPDIAHAVNLLARLLPNEHQVPIGEEESEEERDKREKGERKKARERQLAWERLQQVSGGLAAWEAEMQAAASRRDRPLPLCANAFEAVEQVMRYLRSTQRYGLHYASSTQRGVVKQSAVKLRIECYTDSDFMGDPTDGKSTGGFVILLNGGVVHWACRKQLQVARSTYGAEYVAMAQGIDEVLWLMGLLRGMGFDVEIPVCLWGDNDANNNITTDTRTHDSARGVHNAYHFIRDVAVRSKEIQVQRVDTSDNVADIMTKALLPKQFLKLRAKLVCDAHAVSDARATEGSKGGKECSVSAKSDKSGRITV